MEACALLDHINSSIERGTTRSSGRFSVVLASALFIAALLLPAPVVAAPAFETSSTAVSGNASVTSLTINTPTGTSSGDLLLAAISTDSTETFNTTLNWTLLNQGQSNSSTLAVFYRIATATEPASHTFSWGSGEEAAGAIMRYSGVSTSLPVDVFGVATGTSTNPTAPSVTAISADTRVVRIYGADDDDLPSFPTSPYPPGTTGRFNLESSTTGGSTSLGAADSTQAGTGATGTAAFTLTGNEQWRAVTVVLAPAGVNPLPPGDSNSAADVCSAAGDDGDDSALSGAVNRYFPGSSSVSAGATSIPLGTSIGAGPAIAPGDLLMVIQMQDAAIDSSDSANYGDGSATGTADGSGSTDIGQTGLYELVVATSTVASGGGTVSLATPLVHAYNRGTNQRYQVVRVRQYGDVTLSGNLAATPWDGLAGGILAMSVRGTLNLGVHSIDVSGQGFRGADYSGGSATGSGASSISYVQATGTRWGAKGEGIAGGPNFGTLTNTDGYTGGSLGRGAPGNAGGGGNDHNAGGGGGANIGSGGRGGFAWPNGDVGGKGGAQFAGYSGRLLAGGGGGAGNKNNAGGTGAGGNGGGLVFISAASVQSSGGSIVADGTLGEWSQQDGAGGGGAGGTLLIQTASISGTGLTLSAVGGDGGDSYFPADHGPGGGGGGGAVYIDASGASSDVSGGLPGWRRDTSTSAAETNHGALAGHRGHVVALSDVPVLLACDYGDAPSGYFTASTLHSLDTAGGVAADLGLGSLVDYEWQGDESSGADADNNRDTSGAVAGSDEEGVIFSVTRGSSGKIAATVSVTNSSGATARVCGWMDIGAPPNGAFDPSERQCDNVASGPGSTAVGFEWTVSSTATQTYVSRFRVCSTPVECEQPFGQALDGEMEDYAVTYNPTYVSIGKVELTAITLPEFFTELGLDDADTRASLALLASFDAEAASALQGASAGSVAAALGEYLDPDGDGQVATVRWQTLEERGTIGFYLERRSQGDDAWQRLNDDMLPGMLMAPMGADYWLADPQVRAGQVYEYQLIEVESSGATRRYGPWLLSLPQ